MRRFELQFSDEALSHLDAMHERARGAPVTWGHLWVDLLSSLDTLQLFPRKAKKWVGGRHILTVRARRLSCRVVYRVAAEAVYVLGVVDSRAAEQLRRLAR